MNKDSEKPRFFVDPFAAWRELALKTAEMITVSAYAGAARASAVRVAVIDSNREPVPPIREPRSAPLAPAREAKARPPKPRAAKPTSRKQHKKRGRRK